MPKGIPRPLTSLDERDILILQSLADGETLTEIGEKLVYNRRTLDIRLERIREKILPSKHNTNLIAEAIRKGHID